MKKTLKIIFILCLFLVICFFIYKDKSLNVSALSPEEQVKKDLSMTIEEYYELHDFIKANQGIAPPSLPDPFGINGKRCNQLIITRTHYENGLLYKRYQVLFYDKTKYSYLLKDTNGFIDWQFGVTNSIEIHVTRQPDNTLTYDYEHLQPENVLDWFSTGWFNYFDRNNFNTNLYSYHLAFSNSPIPIFKDVNQQMPLAYFYDPGMNFESNITIKDAEKDAQNRYDDYTKPESNGNIFDRIWDSIVNLPYNISKAISDLFDNLLKGIQNIFSIVFPDKEFFDTYFTNTSIFFKEKLGFIYEFFDIVIDFLKKFLNINSTSKIIKIPKIVEPFSNHILYNGGILDFQKILAQNNILYLHNIYLSFIDCIVLFGLVSQARKEFAKIVGGAKIW